MNHPIYVDVAYLLSLPELDVAAELFLSVGLSLQRI